MEDTTHAPTATAGTIDLRTSHEWTWVPVAVLDPEMLHYRNVVPSLQEVG